MKRLLAVLALCVGVANASLVGSLSTLSGAGLVSGGQTWSAAGGDADDEGFRVEWAVSQNTDGSWHYRYAFCNEAGNPLSMDVSHFIISISEGADVYNLSESIAETEVKTFSLAPGNPGFPTGRTLYGIKLDLHDNWSVAEFDSRRSPMWGDFYVKGGGKDTVNHAYNADLGVEVANLNDYTAACALDAQGNALDKIIVPDTIPEPATLAILSLGSLFLAKRRR